LANNLLLRGLADLDDVFGRFSAFGSLGWDLGNEVDAAGWLT
jgi:hypothetical protein